MRKQFNKLINVTGNLNRLGQTTIFFIIEEAEKPFKIFHTKNWERFNFILFQYNINIKGLNITL